MEAVSQTGDRVISDTDWSDAKSAAQCAREVWRDGSYKVDDERRATRNQHLLIGNHWHVRDRKTGDWGPDVDFPEWRARLSYNDILVSVEQRMAKFVRPNNVWSAGVQSDKLEARIKQRTLAKLMEYYWRGPLSMAAKSAEWDQWAFSSPVVFGHVYWDRTKGPTVPVKLQDWLIGAEMIPDQAQREAYARSIQNRFFQLYGLEAMQRGEAVVPTGDPAVDVVPLFEMGWWPRDVKNFADVVIWQRTVKRPVVTAAETLGIPADEVRRMGSYSPDGTGTGNAQWRDLYFRNPQAFDRGDDSVLIHTTYRMPSPAWPKGRMIITVGQSDEPVFGPDDLPLGLRPIFWLVEKPIRGQATGTNTVDQLRSAQEDTNVSLSQASDYRNSRVAPTLVNFITNAKQKDSLSTRPGRIFTATDATSIPRVIEMPDVPVDYFRFAENNRAWMSRISGVASIDVGTTDDSNVRSGRAIIALRQQNDLRLVPYGRTKDEFIADIGDAVARMLVAYVSAERATRICGDDGKWEVVTWKGSDLVDIEANQGLSDEKMIRVDAYSNIPRDAQEMSNFVSMALTPDATGRSLLDPERDRDQILEMLGMGNLRKVFDRNRLDQLGASRAIESWEAGQPAPVPKESDNHAVYVDEIERWMKTDQYDQAARMFPGVPQDVAKHLDLHRMAAARAAVRPNYDLVRAHVSTWMEARAALLQSLSQPQPGMNPQDQKAQAANAVAIANLMLPLPLIAGGAGGEEQGNREGPEKSEKPKKSKRGQPKSDKSHLQGVRKADQGSAA
ncbi:MAG: hypothetical protein V1929_09115 [bacterium]